MTEEEQKAIINRWSYLYGNFVLWGNEFEVLIATCSICSGLVDLRSFKDHEKWHLEQHGLSKHPGSTSE